MILQVHVSGLLESWGSKSTPKLRKRATELRSVPGGIIEAARSDFATSPRLEVGPFQGQWVRDQAVAGFTSHGKVGIPGAVKAKAAAGAPQGQKHRSEGRARN